MNTPRRGCEYFTQKHWVPLSQLWLAKYVYSEDINTLIVYYIPDFARESLACMSTLDDDCECTELERKIAGQLHPSHGLGCPGWNSILLLLLFIYIIIHGYIKIQLYIDKYSFHTHKRLKGFDWCENVPNIARGGIKLVWDVWAETA